MKQVIRWFLDLYHNGQLDLDPAYQRRSVWTLKDRKFFLDTIFRNYPSPAIFIHKEVDKALGKMRYHVVDGKQRLETIILFTRNDIAIDRDYGDVRLNGKKWKSIADAPDLKTRFYDYALPIELIGTDDSIVINEVFDRLNRTSRKLERQELRHAKYDGWFIKTAEAEAEEDEWERLGVVTKARMRRMKDVQYISELLTVLLKNRIVGYDQDALDDLYAEFDSPDETISNFDAEDFRSKLLSTKDYLLKMETHRSSVTKYAKGLGNFYSLWAFVALNQTRLGPTETTGERYCEFMSKVAALSKERDVYKFSRENGNDAYSVAYDYLKNSVRASADLQQREARNNILEEVLLDRSDREGAFMNKSDESSLSSQNSWSLVRNDGGDRILRLAMGKSNMVGEVLDDGGEESE